MNNTNLIQMKLKSIAKIKSMWVGFKQVYIMRIRIAERQRHECIAERQRQACELRHVEFVAYERGLILSNSHEQLIKNVLQRMAGAECGMFPRRLVEHVIDNLSYYSKAGY